jgi:hypothetical protein
MVCPISENYSKTLMNFSFEVLIYSNKHNISGQKASSNVSDSRR